jgi:hypothetical protein
VNIWRVRVGDYRIVYTIKDDILLVLVLRIGHRREVYRLALPKLELTADIRRAGGGPAKDDPPLVVDPDAVKTREIPFQGFEPVPRRREDEKTAEGRPVSGSPLDGGGGGSRTPVRSARTSRFSTLSPDLFV